MDSLTAEPFRLAFGNAIVARVSAINTVGPGTASPSSVDNPTICDLPSAQGTATLQLIDSSDRMLQLNWTPLFDSARLDEGEDYAYELFWDGGQGSSYTKLTDCTSTTYTMYGYIPGRIYRFKVRTRYPCGSGPDSNDLIVNADGSTRTIDKDGQPSAKTF